MTRVSNLLDWTRWLRTAKDVKDNAILDRRHIYILPTRAGWTFAFFLLLMLAGSINYTLSLGFALVFLLAGIAIAGMLQTWRNLAHLRISCGRNEPVFAGEDASFNFILHETYGRARYAVCARFDSSVKPSASPVCTDILPNNVTTIRLTIKSERRGLLKAGRLRLYTEFPLGLFHAWSYIDMDSHSLIYPRPAMNDVKPPATADHHAKGNTDLLTGDDDFAGHRSYQPGDSPKRVDWKASAREQGMFTKLFQSSGNNTLWFDWAKTPGNDDEQRISQLTRWVLDAHANDQRYGLKLPTAEFKPGNDTAHLNQCLQALALL